MKMGIRLKRKIFLFRFTMFARTSRRIHMLVLIKECVFDSFFLFFVFLRFDSTLFRFSLPFAPSLPAPCFVLFRCACARQREYSYYLLLLNFISSRINQVKCMHSNFQWQITLEFKMYECRSDTRLTTHTHCEKHRAFDNG